MTTVQAAIERLRAQGMHSVLAQFCDLRGVARGKLLPLERLPDAVTVGAGFSGPSIWGTGLPRQGPRSEYYGRIQLDTLRPLPWLEGVAHGVCDGYAGGEPLDTCSRQLLRRQLARLSDHGWTLWVGIEPEFFLLQRDAEGRWRPGDAGDRQAKPSYDLKALHRQQGFIEGMRQALTHLGFALEQIDHEDANGQYEINYRHDEALRAADRFLLFKQAAHAMAERQGLVFSCMPKPFADQPGSGLHCHLSLTDAAGTPVMADPAAAQGLSATGRAFVAGLLAHADALSALCAPTVNSYRRLAVSDSRSGTTWSPVWKAWGDNNRTCLVRTVAGRLEWRLPDAACNIYAALAATLAAGLDGIERGLQPPPARDDDLYQAHAAGASMPARLPRDLRAALDALQADDGLRQAVGLSFCEQFLAVQSAEWADWQDQVSAWELERYVDAF